MIEAERGSGIGGGIWPSGPDGTEVTQLYVEVADIDDALRRAEQLGGKVLVEKQLLPDGDAMAIAIDPLGRSFGLMTSKKT
jgi:predicted enzyme related to lactoylglutathione lyase